MSHEVCRQVDEWIEEEVSRRVETWVEEQRQVCQQQSCNWLCLCCNKWWCGFVSVIVAAVYWVVEKVVRLVTRTVCELIASAVDIVVNVLGGLIGFFVALFSGNWSGAVNSLSRLFWTASSNRWWTSRESDSVATQSTSSARKSTRVT